MVNICFITVISSLLSIVMKYAHIMIRPERLIDYYNNRDCFEIIDCVINIAIVSAPPAGDFVQTAAVRQRVYEKV